MDVEQIRKIEIYLRKLFRNDDIRIQSFSKKNDAAEVYLGQESIGVVSPDEDEGDYNFHMAILGIDLE